MSTTTSQGQLVPSTKCFYTCVSNGCKSLAIGFWQSVCLTLRAKWTDIQDCFGQVGPMEGYLSFNNVFGRMSRSYPQVKVIGQNVKVTSPFLMQISAWQLIDGSVQEAPGRKQVMDTTEECDAGCFQSVCCFILLGMKGIVHEYVRVVSE